MKKVGFTGIDQNNKTATFGFGVKDAATGPQFTALDDAIDAITLASGYKMVLKDETVLSAGSQSPPANPLAQRGMKYLARVQYLTVGGDPKIATFEIGIADYSLLPTGSDFLDLSAGEGLDLKTAVEAVFESDQGTSGVLLSVQQVTRTD